MRRHEMTPDSPSRVRLINYVTPSHRPDKEFPDANDVRSASAEPAHTRSHGWPFPTAWCVVGMWLGRARMHLVRHGCGTGVRTVLAVSLSSRW